MITLDKPTAETSVDELTELVVREYRKAREEKRAAAASAAQDGEAQPPPAQAT